MVSEAGHRDIDLSGRVAIVTGAGQGIGRAFAVALVERGASVVIAERDGERGRAVAEELGGESALFVETDVADAESCAAMVDATRATFGTVHALVNNAAVFSTIEMKPFWELTESEWDDLMAVNLKGVWQVSKATVPALREAEGATIVNMSSGAYWLGRPHYAHYVAAKAGVLGLTRAMARELGGDGIRVNAITPGPVYTEIPRGTVTQAQKQAMLDAQCLPRAAEPGDIVGTMLFLVSGLSGYITGQTINVDGGLAFH